MTETKKPECPWARSEMTPCVIQDGAICYSDPSPNGGGVVCVGCERPKETIDAELARQEGK